ncbi:MAG: TIGR02996 domain-containing protein [Planctomycetia bacterium]|nr:TIGR02996 domain-containing protein [Planctomycetia bacterium]
MASDPGLLQTVLDQPDDDAPRLIYADWLDDQGETARAEFIRVQCALERLPEDDDRRPGLEQREAALLAKHESQWLEALPRDKGIEYSFQRGFVAEASVRWKLFLQHGETIFRLAPIRQLELSYLGMGKFQAEAVGARPELRRLHGLRLKGQLREPGTQKLLQAPNLRGLKALGLAWVGCGEESLKLALGGHLPQLEALDLTNCAMNLCIGLLRQAKLPLRELNLHWNELTARDVEALARAPGLAQLTKLDLSSNAVRVAGAQALANSSVITGLTELDLGGCAIGIAGVTALAQSANGAQLRWLNLNGNNLGVKGLRALVASPHLTALHTLYLHNNALDDDCLALLLDWPGLPKLRSLGLNMNRFTDQGAARLLASAKLSRLWNLNLSENALGQASARAALEATHLEQLRELGFCNCSLPAAAEKTLRKKFGERVRMD